MKQTLCAFGYFDPEGQRSWVIRKGLKEAGFDIRLCRTEKRGFWPKLRDLKAQWKEMRDTIDALYVVFPGHYLMPLAWRLARKKHIPVILDVFISLYEAEVEDRARLRAWHPKAWMLWFADWLACMLATVILIDTEEHREYFVRRYRIPREKFLIIPVGCRTDLFRTTVNCQQLSVHRRYSVAFHGSFIPLHGIETILRAAEVLRNDPVEFILAGKGQTLPKMKALAGELRLGNVRFLDFLPLREIPDFIAGADVCLGIFGTSAKAARVVPTKAFEIIAMGRPLITARTPATEHVFRDRENALLSTPGDPHDLAAMIRELMQNPALAESIARAGHRLFIERFQPHSVVEPLAEWLSHRR